MQVLVSDLRETSQMCSSLPTPLRKWTMKTGIHKILYLYLLPFSTFYTASTGLENFNGALLMLEKRENLRQVR